ncbi:MAG: hypothetical protein PHZ23_16220 [Acidiphilium sp.]|nr:hypothetical protein [Acidiphilium sp.]
MTPTPDYQTLITAARRNLAMAIIINQSNQSPAFPLSHLIATRDRIKLAERTAAGGCTATACRMLRGVLA